MTNEERENAIRCLKLWIEREPQIQTYKTCLEALEQQPVTTTNNDEPITVIYPTIVCDDAISREELLKAIDTWDKFGYTETGCFVREPKGDYVPYIHYDDVIKCIKGMPPVTQKSEKWIDGVHAMGYREGYKDAQKQKSGKWITDARTYYEELNKRGLGVDEYTPYFTDDIACSVCLAKYNTIDNETQFFKHCPNCGAKMVEPQESEDKE